MKQDISFIKKNTLYSFQIGVLSKGLGFVSQYLMILWLSVSAYGQYTYLISIVGLVAIFLQLGLRTYILKSFSPHFSCGRMKSAMGVFLAVLKLELLICLPLFLTYETIVYFLVETDKVILQVLGVIFVYRPLFALLQTFIQAMRKIILFKIISDLYLILATLILVGNLYFWVDGKIEYALMIRALLLLVMSIYLLTYIYKKLGTGSKDITYPSYKDVLAVSLPMVFAGIMTVITNKTDIIMLGSLSSYESVGVYNIAFLLSQLAIFGLQSSNTVLAPMISNYYHNNDKEGLKNIVALGSFISSLFAILVALFLIVFGEYILTFINEKFSIGFFSMRILLLGFVINASFGPVGYILTMTNRQKVYMSILYFSAILNIGLNYFLIPKYGLNGAAFATMCSMVFWNIVSAFYVFKHYKISTFGLQPAKIYHGYKVFKGVQ